MKKTAIKIESVTVKKAENGYIVSWEEKRSGAPRYRYDYKEHICQDLAEALNFVAGLFE